MEKVILSFALICGAWSGFSLYHALERGFPKGMEKLGESLPVEGSILFTVLGAIIFCLRGLYARNGEVQNCGRRFTTVRVFQ